MTTRLANFAIKRRPSALMRPYTGSIPIVTRRRTPTRTRTTPNAVMPMRPNIGIGSGTGITLPGARTSSVLTGGGVAALPTRGGGISTQIGDLGGSIGGALGNAADTAKGLIPTAIKVVLAVIVIKIVLWLIRGRRR